MLSDGQWAMLEPLVEACRPKAKTPPGDLRRTMSAILWRHQNGAKWRRIPEELGPWWQAAQMFIRWARAGVWERLLGLVQERKAASAARRRDLKLSGTIVKRLAALVAGMGPRLA